MNVHFPESFGKDDRVEIDELVGAFVAEVGIRQAWPFLGFCNNRSTPSREVRLYLDAPWSLGENQHDATDDTAWLMAAAQLNGQSIASASVSSEGTLRIAMTDGGVLEVSGRAASTTVGEPWWLGT